MLEDERLQLRGRPREAHHRAAMADDRADGAHELGQRVDAWPAQRIGLAEGALVADRGDDGARDVLDPDRLKTRARGGERYDGKVTQQRREEIEEAVVLAEHHGWAEDGAGNTGRARALLALRLRAQVLARRVAGGAERAHVDEVAYAGRAARLGDLARQLHVRRAESRMPAFVQDADEVHRRVHVVEHARERRGVVRIGGHRFQRRQDEQRARAHRASRHHAHAQPARRGRLGHGTPDEAAAAEDANALDVHGRYGMLDATSDASPAVPGTTPSISCRLATLPVNR